MRRWLAATLVLSCGCGSGEDTGACGEGEQLVDGQCVPVSSCPEPAIQLPDGTCATVGTPAEACADGFTPVAGACEPILPAGACGPGTMAIPGETTCRPIMDCPVEPWGGIDPGPTPQWVDGSYAGGDSDGSQARPWPTIQVGIDAAVPGAVIAIAAGSYVGNVRVNDKTVHLRGVCPTEVEIVGVGTANDWPAVMVTGTQASGTSFSGLAVTGPSAGLSMSGVTDVHIERVWVHDTGGMGIDAEDPLGPVSVTVADTLVEGAFDRGLLALGAAMVVERSVVRHTVAGGTLGRGVHVRVSNYTDSRSSFSLSQSVLTTNEGGGLAGSGSDVTLHGSVVHASLPSAQQRGQGVAVQCDTETGHRANLELVGSAIVDNHVAGVMLFGSVMRMERTLVRGTLPHPGADPDYAQGRGINLQDDITGDRGSVEVVSSTVDRHHGVGLFATGTDLSLEGTLIRDILTADGQGGRGINLQPGEPSGEPVVATIGTTLVEGVTEFGIMVGESQVSLSGSVIREVAANADALFGDGVAVLTSAAQVDSVGSSIEHCDRAGLSVFGGSTALASTRLWCHPINIALQIMGGGEPSLTDHGGNQCGCGDQTEPCQATTTELVPPSPL